MVIVYVLRTCQSQLTYYYSTDFYLWKKQTETDTNSWYVKATGTKCSADHVTVYYYCNRSGYFLSKRDSKRHLKSQGSSKLNTYCTSSITLRTGEGCLNNVEVEFCKTHYGHSVTLGHIRLTEEAKLNIATKLLHGVTFERILDDIRDSVDSTIQRVHLTTRKDIENIERAYGLKEAQRHKDDATSVMSWVLEMKQNCPNPVRNLQKAVLVLTSMTLCLFYKHHYKQMC